MLTIKKNTNGDSRVADHVPTFEEFNESNHDHINDVNNVSKLFCSMLMDRVSMHDWTKVVEPYRTMFYDNLTSAICGDKDFMSGDWAKLHYGIKERHHLSRRVPDDVNLFDIVEMVCDCVAAGLARSGEVYPIELDPSILNASIENTVTLLKSQIEVIE